MDVLLTLLLLGFGSLTLLAASPFLLYFGGKKLLNKWKNPYEKTFRSYQELTHPYRSFFRDFAQSKTAVSWMKPDNKKLSAHAKAVLLSFYAEEQRFFYLKSLSADDKTVFDAFYRKHKKGKLPLFETAYQEILGLLQEQANADKPSYESLLFLQYDSLYTSIMAIETLKKKTNHVLQHQVDQIVKKSLALFPKFTEYKLFELNHKFKTLLQKDLIESVDLLSSIDRSQQLDKEAELYTVLKVILREIEEIEETFQNNAEDALEQKMRIMKQKFKMYGDE